MTLATVHNLRGRVAEFLADPLAVYVGRTGWYRLADADLAACRAIIPLPKRARLAGAKVWLIGDAWGNTLRAGRDGAREHVVAAHRAIIHSDPRTLGRIRDELSGRRLYCWCAPLPCHADNLAAVANGGRVVAPAPAPASSPSLFDSLTPEVSP